MIPHAFGFRINHNDYWEVIAPIILQRVVDYNTQIRRDIDQAWYNFQRSLIPIPDERK